jgi:hypothetical protein
VTLDSSTIEILTLALRRRRAVIADHAWRDREAAAHLDALRSVSEEIMAWTEKNRGQLDPRLEHYLDRCSYDKALAHLESGGTAPHHP